MTETTEAFAKLKPNVKPISVTFSEIEVPKYDFYICKAQLCAALRVELLKVSN